MKIYFQTVDVVHSEDWRLNPSGRGTRRLQSEARSKSKSDCDGSSPTSSNGREVTDSQAWDREVLVQVSSLQQTNFHAVKLLPRHRDPSEWHISVRSGGKDGEDEETIIVDDSMQNKFNIRCNALVYDHEQEDLISMLNMSPTTVACMVKRG
ncbi:hypothetical protein JMJ77_0002014 [Colletotrichum scovillei]|uniref:Uncharacterized protein n=1 Tax=Colletotrichum scovillei TaxID=1209932 RepID=A0A9P7R875_9PEZI|nr:hypothetical protein JMJ77_0002014 [Colletotrichum scovillei]KAG7070427.1 hypothetical protein JMJ76_0001680 [Colletotrichum scovillei]KAG7078702.1 hypothetical protein JMJ78_0002370 [Colletotrichum scovillei]